MKETTEAKRLSFTRQFQMCDADGRTIHMNKALHDSMPKKERREYAIYKKENGMPANYYGHKGPLFCGIKPGLCSAAHCPLRDRATRSP